MSEPKKYIDYDEYLDMCKHIEVAISALTSATEGLRTVTLLIAASLAKQKSINAPQLIADISSMIEGHYPQDAVIPTVVLDFRAELARRLLDNG